eukprot:11072008-Alexandrium_andersonii.AAC.1
MLALRGLRTRGASWRDRPAMQHTKAPTSPWQRGVLWASDGFLSRAGFQAMVVGFMGYPPRNVPQIHQGPPSPEGPVGSTSSQRHNVSASER